MEWNALISEVCLFCFLLDSLNVIFCFVFQYSKLLQYENDGNKTSREVSLSFSTVFLKNNYQESLVLIF